MSLPLVEIATESNVFVGRCTDVAEPAPRLLDVLNKDSQLLVLADCKIRRLGQREDDASVAKTCFVPKDRIVWARPLEPQLEPQQDGRRRRRRQPQPQPQFHFPNQYHIEKEPHSVVAIAPPFRIAGNAHVLPGADPTTAIARLLAGFLPLTDARAIIEGDKKSVWEVDVLLLNGRKTDFITAELVAQLSESANDLQTAA